MTNFKEMTRKELATIIVDDQIKRGILKAEARAVVIKGYLRDRYCAMAKYEMINYCNKRFA